MNSEKALEYLEKLKKREEEHIISFEKMGIGKSNHRTDKELFEVAITAIKFKQYFDDLYGKGLDIENWHLNGDLEPFDNFYESAISYAEQKEIEGE